MSRPRIGCVTIEYPPFAGGVAKALFGLVQASQGAVEVLTLDPAHTRWWSAFRQIWKFGKRFDLVLVSHVLPIGTGAWLAHRFGGAPYAVWILGTDLRRARAIVWKRWVLRKILREAFIVYTNSAFVRDEVRAFDPQVHPIVITPALEPRTLPSREEARRALGLSAEDQVIVTVARLVPRKGIDCLIEAFALMPSATKLVVIGRGVDEERLKNLVKDQKDRVTFLTSASDQDRDAWLAASDVFALTGRDEGDDVEGFGIVYLEAAAAGLPVVAGRSGGVAEAMVDGVTGTLVDPEQPKEIAQAIAVFLEDPERSRRFGAAGRARVSQDFRWEDRWAQVEATLPLVSVIIPVFNRPAAFRRCLLALAQQSYRSFEVIVVDDGSEEDVASAVKASSLHDRIQFHRFASNQGAPKARNTGFDLSQGSLTLFLDADAMLEPQALEQMVRALRMHPEAAFAYGDFYLERKRFYGQPFDRAALARANYIHTTSLLRREAFPGFDQALRRFQDWDLWLTLAERGQQGVWIPEPLFRLSGRGTMSRWLPSFVHRLPWECLGWMPEELRRYRAAEKIIRTKHAL